MKRLFAIFCAISILSVSISSITVLAEEKFSYEETTKEEPIVETVGLISDYYLSVRKSGTTLYLNAWTKSNSTMKSIGFKDIVVQYSSNQSDWDTYATIDNILSTSDKSCYMTDYSVSITNGYYYRVTLNHYAKESGWFGSSQSVPNISNVVS